MKLSLIKADEATRTRLNELAAPITKATGVSLNAMASRSRYSRVTDARHQLMAAMWRAGFSLVEIGELLNRNHTTALSAIRKSVGVAEYRAVLKARRPGTANVRVAS